jgi:2-C-methyl-D-erythritol 2,4-cyclodiphosphate synthase
MSDRRVGIGYDVHRLAVDRPLVLGGVTIPSELGLLGHSDADVLTHAICDALLGAAGLGDIGIRFPDSDEQYRGICSLRLLEKVVRFVREAGYAPSNVDATIVAERPRLVDGSDRIEGDDERGPRFSRPRRRDRRNGRLRYRNSLTMSV